MLLSQNDVKKACIDVESNLEEQQIEANFQNHPGSNHQRQYDEYNVDGSAPQSPKSEVLKIFFKLDDCDQMSLDETLDISLIDFESFFT